MSNITWYASIRKVFTGNFYYLIPCAFYYILEIINWYFLVGKLPCIDTLKMPKRWNVTCIIIVYIYNMCYK